MYRSILPAALLCLVAGGLFAAAEPPEARKAPTRLYRDPSTFLLLRLGGDRAHFQYTPGSLDRAANLQTRLELVARQFERWSGKDRVEFAVVLLSRREWEEAQIDVEYGVPVRVGTRGIAAPARGDAGTVKLWAELLGGTLPTVMGTPILGTPQEVASMVVADVFVQLLAGEIYADSQGMRGDEPWVRPVMAHLAALAVVERARTDRSNDLAVLYRQLLARHPPNVFSVHDYTPDLSLEDWLWFQAQFHFAARAIYEKEGKDSVKKLRKRVSKGKSGISAERLRRKYKQLDEWLKTNFAVVSRRR